MNVGDYVILHSDRTNAAIWRVTGVYLGVVGQQSCVGLVAINRMAPSMGDEDIDEMLCPIELVKPHIVQSLAKGSSHE